MLFLEKQKFTMHLLDMIVIYFSLVLCIEEVQHNWINYNCDSVCKIHDII